MIGYSTGMVYLHVTYVLEAQDVARFEALFAESFLPVILDHGLEPLGMFKTLVGRAGEITEIWRFESLGDYERKWRALMADPRVTEILKATGPMVKDETFKLMESVAFLPLA